MEMIQETTYSEFDLKKAQGKYILILNADIIVLEKAISKMLEYIKSHPNVGVLGPRLLDFTNNIKANLQVLCI